jgi:purine-binding chemotaxis protein CheW
VSDLFLIAHIAGRGVAIDAAQVDSVVDIGEIVAVPRAEAFVRGLAALRSRVVTVIDTGIALGLAPTPDTMRRAVITIVDGLRGGWASVGTGLVERDGEPLLIIDLAVVLPTSPLAA